MSNKIATIYRNSAKYPIRFDALHPGSTFRIVREVSRGLPPANDGRLYVRAKSHEGFYSTELGSNTPCILMPHDLVMPVVKENK